MAISMVHCDDKFWVNISNSGITSLENVKFSNPETSKFSASHNKITEIPLHFFHEAVALVEVDLSQNKLRQINGSAFPVENHVKRVNLSFNKFGAINPELIKQLYELEKLNLSGNRIAEIQANAFVASTNLKDVDLSHNKIVRIDRDAFPLLNKLESLILAFNHIEELEVVSFQKQNCRTIESCDFRLLCFMIV